MKKEAESSLQDVDNVPKIVIRHKAVVSSPAGDHKLSELVWVQEVSTPYRQVGCLNEENCEGV